jgi:hypothetical protein
MRRSIKKSVVSGAAVAVLLTLASPLLAGTAHAATSAPKPATAAAATITPDERDDALDKVRLGLSGVPQTAVRGKAFVTRLTATNPSKIDLGSKLSWLHFTPVVAKGGTALKTSDLQVRYRLPGGQFKNMPVSVYYGAELLAELPSLKLPAGGKSSVELEITVKSSAPAKVSAADISVSMGTGHGSPKPARASFKISGAAAPSTKPSAKPTTKPATTGTKTVEVAKKAPQLAETGGNPATPALIGAGGLLVLVGGGAAFVARRRTAVN